MLELKHLVAGLLAACMVSGCTPRRPGEVPALVEARDAQAVVVQTD